MPDTATALIAFSSPLDFAHEIESELGAPQTPANDAALVAWEKAEGGHWANSASFNPLNTTLTLPGATSMNSVGVKRYVSPEQGIEGTVKTLEFPRYAKIVNDLRTGNVPFSQFAADVGSSGWGTPASLILGSGGKPYNPPGQSDQFATAVGAGTAPDVPVSVSGQAAGASSQSAPRILKTLDDALNVSGVNILNPLADLRVILTRGAVVMVGIVLIVAGLALTIGPRAAKIAETVAPVAEIAAA